MCTNRRIAIWASHVLGANEQKWMWWEAAPRRFHGAAVLQWSWIVFLWAYGGRRTLIGEVPSARARHTTACFLITSCISVEDPTAITQHCWDTQGESPVQRQIKVGRGDWSRESNEAQQISGKGSKKNPGLSNDSSVPRALEQGACKHHILALKHQRLPAPASEAYLKYWAIFPIDNKRFTAHSPPPFPSRSPERCSG